MAESIVKSCNSKHSVLKEIGKKKLKLLNKMKIFVIGAGGLGNPLLQYLSRFNLKQITIIDYDIVEKSNLERQILFNKKDINKAKAIVCIKQNQGIHKNKGNN
jgi:adenylyltransferase/sulfurtransferase